MAKVTCNCGSIIHDVSDGLPCKAHLLADQDFFDGVEIGQESYISLIAINDFNNSNKNISLTLKKRIN